ncbi:MAG: hypothetical protein ACK55Z_22295, partial [bacterium]
HFFPLCSQDVLPLRKKPFTGRGRYHTSVCRKEQVDHHLTVQEGGVIFLIFTCRGILPHVDKFSGLFDGGSLWGLLSGGCLFYLIVELGEARPTAL